MSGRPAFSASNDEIHFTAVDLHHLLLQLLFVPSDLGTTGFGKSSSIPRIPPRAEFFSKIHFSLADEFVQCLALEWVGASSYRSAKRGHHPQWLYVPPELEKPPEVGGGEVMPRDSTLSSYSSSTPLPFQSAAPAIPCRSRCPSSRISAPLSLRRDLNSGRPRLGHGGLDAHTFPRRLTNGSNTHSMSRLVSCITSASNCIPAVSGCALP